MFIASVGMLALGVDRRARVVTGGAVAAMRASCVVADNNDIATGSISGIGARSVELTVVYFIMSLINTVVWYAFLTVLGVTGEVLIIILCIICVVGFSGLLFLSGCSDSGA